MKDIKKILVIRQSSLGDVLLATPVVRALKTRLPDARIDFAVKAEFAAVLKGNPHIDRLILRSDKRFSAQVEQVRAMNADGGYDLVADLHRNPRSLHMRLFVKSGRAVKMNRDRFRRWLLVHLGVDRYGDDMKPVSERYFSAFEGVFDPPLVPDEKGLDLFLDDADRSEVAARLPDGGCFVIAPSAKWPTKRWPAEKFAEAGKILAERHKLTPVMLGAKEDKALCAKVAEAIGGGAMNLAGELSIRGSAAVIERAAFFIGNDTGLMHIASALQRPGAVVFGPTTRHFGYFPYHSNIGVVEKIDLACRPCTKQGHKKCPKGHFKCMMNVTVAEAVGEVEARLRSIK